MGALRWVPARPRSQAVAQDAPDAPAPRMLPQAVARSEHERYYDCATEPSKQEPSLQLVRHNAMKCWEGYERVPGTKEGEKGSCRPKGGKKKKKSSSQLGREERRRQGRKSAEEDAEKVSSKSL